MAPGTFSNHSFSISAGTAVDFGCFAPVNVFIDIFKNAGIEVTMEEAREPMGMLKIDHIRAMLSMPHKSEKLEFLPKLRVVNNTF
ncbi:beta-phosphoglucomutase-like phosphatase (HAD superfamily) [Neobacillus niacini]|nr:beta-phosphoglucomutase-like phosphatase (HAD superfamily) [Neobacillus niacini]